MTKTKIIINLGDPPSINGITSIQRKLRFKKHAAHVSQLLLEIGMGLFALKITFNMAHGTNTLFTGFLWISIAAAYSAAARENLSKLEAMCDHDLRMLDYVSVDQKIKEKWLKRSMEANHYMRMVRYRGRPLTRVEVEMLEKLCRQEQTRH